MVIFGMNSLNFNPLNISTSILTNDKILLKKVVDVMKREVIVKPNTILFTSMMMVQLKRNILISRLNVPSKIVFTCLIVLVSKNLSSQIISVEGVWHADTVQYADPFNLEFWLVNTLETHL